MQSLWMLGAGLAFALMGVVVKVASPHFGTAELVFWRSVAQAVVAYAMLVHAGQSVRTRHVRGHAGRSFSGFVAMLMFFHALRELPVATAMTLNYTSPLFQVLLLAALAGQRLGAKLVGAVLLGFVGVVLVLRPTIGAEAFWPALLGLLSGAIGAVAYWNIRELVRADEPEARVVFYFGVVSLVGSLAWAIVSPDGWHGPSSHTWWMLLGVGALGALGQFAMTRAYGQGSTLVAATLSYSGIVFSSVIGVLWLGDRPPWAAWAGIALIVVAGILAVHLRPDRRVAAPPQLTND